MPSNRKKEDKSQESLIIKNLAYYVSQGYTIENAAYKIDIDPIIALELTSKPEYERILGEISPLALQTWKESKEDDSVLLHVRQQAKKDGMLYYKQMKADIDALDPKERIPLLEKLLRLGGYFDKEETREIVNLAPSAIAAIREAKDEMDLKPDEIKSPYDA